jgi:hypothetical protein
VNCLETNLLVIGGGATGTGIAWDAALRGFFAVTPEDEGLYPEFIRLRTDVSQYSLFGYDL